MNPAAQISRTTGAKARARKLAATIWDRAPGARPRPCGTPLASPRSLFAAIRFSISEPDNEQQRGLKPNAVSLDQIKRLFVGGFAPIWHTTFLQPAMDGGRTDGLRSHFSPADGPNSHAGRWRALRRGRRFRPGPLRVSCVHVYVIPALIAWDRRHPAAGMIWEFTILLGWTGVGWPLALIWAFKAPGAARR